MVAGFFVVGSRNNFNACCGNLGMIFRRILACACVGAEEVQGVDVVESGLPVEVDGNTGVSVSGFVVGVILECGEELVDVTSFAVGAYRFVCAFTCAGMGFSRVVYFDTAEEQDVGTGCRWVIEAIFGSFLGHEHRLELVSLFPLLMAA